MAIGQDLELELLDLTQMVIVYVDQNIVPLELRMNDFSRSFSNEAHQLQVELLELRRQLQELAVQNSDGQDVSLCLEIAVEDTDEIIAERSEYIFATTNIVITFSLRLRRRPIYLVVLVPVGLSSLL